MQLYEVEYSYWGRLEVLAKSIEDATEKAEQRLMGVEPSKLFEWVQGSDITEVSVME